MTTEVLVERDGAVARVILNRPERRNALNDELVEALGAAVAELSAATWCRGMVLTGAGKAFCAGGDLDANSHGAVDANAATARHRQFLTVANALHCFPKPTIAAVNGAAVGAGFALALLCDEVLVHMRAKLSLGFLQVGLPPDLMSAATVQRRAGWTVATDLLHTGRFVSAAEAVAIKLVHQAVDGDVLAAASERAHALAAMSPVAFAATKALLREAAAVPISLLEHEALAVGRAVATDEFQLASARFRKPSTAS